MKKILSLILVALLPLVASAETVEIDGIYYNLVSKIKEAEVTSNPNGYSGAVNIPATVTYEGVTYSVTSIGNSAFEDCSSLTSVTIGNSVTNIGDGAFNYCRGLTSITIPGSVTSIGEKAFYNCRGLKKVIVPDIAAWCGISFGKNEANPLCNAHHLYCDEETEITNLVIPDGVTSISDRTFSDCTGLTSVTIGNSVTSIGDDAFSGCSGLTSVTIGNSVTSIGDYAFYVCSGLTSINIPNSVTSIGGAAFSGCSGLTSVTIGNGVTSIEPRAFEFSGLTSITIPNSVTSIGGHAFFYCISLTSVIIGSGVTSIGESAFTDCFGLTSITIPNNVTSIGDYTFGNCSGLTSINIGNGVTSIGSSVFSGCSGLTSVNIPNSVTSIGYRSFSGCTSLTSVIIPNSVTDIDSEAFSGCSGLPTITIPNSVTNIGFEAFFECNSLTSVTIGNGVKSIDYQAFGYCPELADVYCYAEEVPETGSKAFEGSYIEYATLYVPESAIEQYRATEPWRQFGTIKTTDGNIPDPPKPEICATPTISYANGKLTFSSETEGAECVATVSDTDIKTHYGNEISLTATYTITVYATKAGYENSEVATGTLCWIDVAPQTEGIVNEDAVMEVKAMPVLIQSEGGTISIQGAAEGTPIAVYDAEGKQYGSTIADKDRATITTSLRPGSIAVVKIGEKSIKVLIK